MLHECDEEAFGLTSWLAIHAGMDHWPERHDPVIGEVPREHARSALQARRNAIKALVDHMPQHHRTLRNSLG